MDNLRALSIAYVAFLVAFLLLDAIWLGTMHGRLYKPQLGALLRDAPLWAPAAAFYLLYTLGVTALVVAPRLGGAPLQEIALFGALFGVVAYGTYDLSNYATLRGWSLTVTIADMAWGAFATGIAAAGAVWTVRSLS